MQTRTIRLPRLYRLHPIELRQLGPESAARADLGADDEVFEIAISSETPVERRGWFGERWVEVLVHSPDAIDMRRLEKGISFLDSHIPDRVRGIVEGGRLDPDKVIRGRLRFSVNKDAQELKRDILHGIRPYISIGYDPKRARKVSEDEHGVPTFHVTRWEPVESSSVGVPADFTVGVGRSVAYEVRASDNPEMFEVEIEDETSRREGETMGNEAKPGQGGTIVEPRGTTPEQGPAAPAQPAAPSADGLAGARAAAAEIIRTAEAHGMAARASEWIERGLTPDQVAGEILKAKRQTVQGQPPAEALQLPEKDRSRYSYARAILEAATREGGKFAGLEGEVHQELARKLPEGYEARGGILVPMRLHDPMAGPRTRAMDSLTASKGTELVFDRPGELIELLKAQAYVVQRGARVLTGLLGPVTFPKHTGGFTIYWVGENPPGDVTESDLALGEVKLAQKTVMGTTSYSRQLLAQAGIDVESMVREELSSAHALGIDRASLHGAGTAGEPMGIYFAPDVQVKAMGGIPDFAKLVDMIGLVADKNALGGSLGWLTTPLMAAKMMQTLEASAAGASWIWRGTMESGVMAGYPASATNQVSKTLGGGANEHGLIFGNWRDILIGLWNAMELVIDPYAKKKRAMIEVTTFQMVDVVLRHGESFAKATGAVVTT